MSCHPRKLYKSIDLDFMEAAASLEADNEHDGLRFDRVTVDESIFAQGRIGRRYFVFTLDDDEVSLVIGSACHRRRSGLAKRARRKGLRRLRRGTDSITARRALRPVRDTYDGRYPELRVWFSRRTFLQGPEVHVPTDPEEIAGLFTDLMGSLQRSGPRVGPHCFEGYRRRSSTRPMNHRPGIISKPSKNHL